MDKVSQAYEACKAATKLLGQRHAEQNEKLYDTLVGVKNDVIKKRKYAEVEKR
jgi:hypothetical protein